jgi:hypothetical protein
VKNDDIASYKVPFRRPYQVVFSTADGKILPSKVVAFKGNKVGFPYYNSVWVTIAVKQVTPPQVYKDQLPPQVSIHLANSFITTRNSFNSILKHNY